MRLLLPLLLGVSPFFLGVRASAAPPVVDEADRKVAAKLTQVLQERVKSPGGKVRFVVSPTARSSEGYFSQVRVVGAPAVLRQLRVSAFDLHAKNVRLDVPSLFRENKVRTVAATTTLRAVISERDLTQTLGSGKHTKKMNLKVKYLGNRIRVTGDLNYGLINGPVVGTARLRLAPGHKVFLDILSLKLRGVEVPAFLKTRFEGHINPVIDYQDLPFNPPFKGVKVSGDKATIHT